MKFRALVALSASVMIVALLAGCPGPISTSRDGSLTISISNDLDARTLLPDIDMNAASFAVIGSGPGEAGFSESTSGAPLTLDGLVFGTWSVTVNALNAGGTLIGSGQSTVAVHTGQTATVEITVVPLGGNGTLSLGVSWTASQVERPSIDAQLTAPAGPSIPLSFSIEGNEGQYSSATIPAGYQTLTVQLLDSGVAVMGAVEVVRIVAGQTTRGSYQFTNVNAPGGAVLVKITPAMAEPIPVSITGVGAVLGVGGSMTAQASVSDGTANAVYVWYLNGASVGMGASYAVGSNLAVGTYRLDVTAYTADGTRGGSATAGFRVTAGSAQARLYAASDGTGDITGFTIGSDGLLSLSSTSSNPAVPDRYALAVTPNRAFLYTTNLSGTISGFAVGPDGVLAPLSTPSVATGFLPYGVAITPNGAFLYTAAYGSNTVSGYRIEADGLLMPLSTPAFAAGVQPQGIAVTPNGSFLFVSNTGGATLSGYAIGADGVLTPSGTFATGTSPGEMSVTPDGSYLYVINAFIHAVAGYSIGSDGMLTPLSPPTVGSWKGPRALAITPNGAFLYVANYTSSNITAFSIGTGGSLTPLSTPVYATGRNPTGMAITPDGSFLYVSSTGDGLVSGYAIGAEGQLTPLSVPSVSAGSEPYKIVIVPAR